MDDMPSFAVAERRELAATLRATGPGVPTLCGGWTSEQLAAHLVLRERSLVEVVGRLPIAALHEYAEQRLDRYATSRPFGRLADEVLTGPPWWSPWSIPPLREAVNLLEYTVHHEDLRRGAGDLSPRPLPVDRQWAIWRKLRAASRFTLRSVPVTVVLAWPSHGEIGPRRNRPGRPTVTATGDPVELALVAFGRQRAAHVDYTGATEAIDTLTGARIAI
jgi:uncharacterized protein (TIGR03085 family)